MILSHKHKFIFIKTTKTGGTAVEFALSKLCGDEDVITPVKEEEDRKLFSGRSAQNYKTLDGNFYNHMSLKEVQEIAGQDNVSDYFKFTISRNPFERAVSLYYFGQKGRDEAIPIEKYLNDKRLQSLFDSGWGLYNDPNSSNLLVDTVIEYESLQNGLNKILHDLGCKNGIDMPKVKAQYRPQKTSPSQVLPKEIQAKIHKYFNEEITQFGYKVN